MLCYWTIGSVANSQKAAQIKKHRNRQRERDIEQKRQHFQKLHINEYFCQAWFRWLSFRPIYMHRNGAKRFVCCQTDFDLNNERPTNAHSNRLSSAFKWFTFWKWRAIVSSLIIIVVHFSPYQSWILNGNGGFYANFWWFEGFNRILKIPHFCQMNAIRAIHIIIIRILGCSIEVKVEVEKWIIRRMHFCFG